MWMACTSLAAAHIRAAVCRLSLKVRASARACSLPISVTFPLLNLHHLNSHWSPRHECCEKPRRHERHEEGGHCGLAECHVFAGVEARIARSCTFFTRHSGALAERAN